MSFLLMALATWRLSHLLAEEEGPGDLAAKLRQAAGVRYDEQSKSYGTNIFSKGLICQWCNSIWLGALLTVVFSPRRFWHWVVMPFALSAASLLIGRVMEK